MAAESILVVVEIPKGSRNNFVRNTYAENEDPPAAAPSADVEQGHS